jgi:hypothetical protein
MPYCQLAQVDFPPPSVARKYQHPYKHYADLYGVSLPSVKRYAAAGRPLDDPDAMGEFLSTRGRKPDDDEGVRKNEPSEDSRTEDDREAEARIFIPGPEFFDGEGLGAEIRRLTLLTKEAAKRLGDAMVSNDARARQNRLKEYLDLVQAQRQVEKEQPGILRETAKAILISEVEEGVTRLLLSIVERLKTIPTRAMQTLVGLTAAEIREDLERELDQAFEPIRKCEWVPEEYRPAPISTPAPAVEEKPEKPAPKRKVPKSGTKKPASKAKTKGRKK